ncbi:MAG: hypothetical protein Q8R00_04470 [Candidatus Nanoarchaeia archaeon]|nr:hypothetical protein [Candidatus Nanoarchaeia archaeon]
MARHRHKKQEGVEGSAVLIITIVLITALFLLRLAPNLPSAVDIGGASTISEGDKYTEQSLIRDITGACFDTDGGINELVKGTVTINENFAEDACNTDTNLVEYYCEEDKLKFTFLPCSEFCREGKCVKKPKVKEHFKISQKSDGLELNEALGDVVEALTSRELSSLSGGTISTKSGSTRYHQYLRFDAEGMDSGEVQFSRDEAGSTEDFLFFESGEDIFEYELEFENGLKSTIASDNTLTELEDEKLNILGRSFEVVESKISGSSVSLTFMSGAVKDEIKEGLSSKYQVDGIDYEIKVVIIEESNPPRVTLQVNDETTPPLEDGEIFITSSGLIVGVADLLISEAGEGSDIARLYVGAERIKFLDTFTDDSFSTNVDVNGELIEGGKTRIEGSRSGGDFEFYSLFYRLEANAVQGGDVFVSKNHGVKEYVKEPQGFLGALDIVYSGLLGSKGTSSTTLELRPKGGDEYNLVFMNRNGNLYNIPFVSNRGGTFKLGTSQYDLLFEESGSPTSYFIDLKDIFVVNSRDDTSGYSAVMRYNSIDISNNVVHFDDFATGKKSATYSGEVGVDAQGTLNAGGVGFKFYVGPAPDYQISIDLDNSGDVDGGEAKIVIAGGGVLDLGSTNSPGGSFSITLTTAAKLRDSPGLGAEVLQFNILDTGSGVDVEVPSQSALPMNSVKGEKIGMSDVGVFVRLIESDPNKLEVGYGSGGQRLANVAIVIIAQEDRITKKVSGLTAFAVFYDFFNF